MSGPSDLGEEQERHLVQVARDARLRAHAPYSHFAVGAALMDEQGRVHAGANIENAAYPQGLCAEAAALAHLVVANQVRGGAVVGDPGSRAPSKKRPAGRLDLAVPQDTASRDG